MLGRPGELGAGLEERDGRVVIDRLGVHRLDEAEFVDDARGVRQQLADPGPALAVLGEAEPARRDREARLPRRHAGEPLAHRGSSRAARSPARSWQQRLVVEQVHLRRRARLEQVDHPLRPGREIGEAPMPAPTETGHDRRPPRHGRGRAATPAPRAEAQAGGPAEELPARQVLAEFDERVHVRLFLRDRFVEVQDQLRDRGVGRQLGRVEAGVGRGLADADQLPAAARSASRKRAV